MGGDSNPRYLAVNTLSRRAQSTTLPPILKFPSANETAVDYAGLQEQDVTFPGSTGDCDMASRFIALALSHCATVAHFCKLVISLNAIGASDLHPLY